MSYQLQGSEDNRVVLYAVVVAAVFLIFILPKLEKKFAQEESEVREKMESLRGSSIRKLDTNKCSRDCCLYTQWPVPHMPTKKSDKYVGTNFMCNGNGGGCLCVSKKDREYLARRGQNFMPCSGN